MKIPSIVAGTPGVFLTRAFGGLRAQPSRTGLGAQVPGRSLRKRISAMLRLACRVLGLKRRKGLGLALLGASAAALLAAAPVQAGNGIHINANASGACVSVNDPQAAPSGGTDFNRYLQANVNFNDTSAQCNSSAPNQKDSVLFHRPEGVSGVGATSLMLGGELFVNGGYLKLGDETTGQRIGDATTRADANGLAIGNGAEAKYRGVSLGLGARATGSDAATAVGKGALGSGFYSVALGADSNATFDRATALGAGAKATADSATAVGADAQASAGNAFAAGKGAVAQAADSVAIGSGANASHGLSVALGSGASTRAFQKPPAAVLNGKSYTFDSQNLQGVVSVGGPAMTRQIVNVAPGMVNATSTDAVNGSQLYAAYDAINTLGGVDKTLQAGVDKGTADVATTRAGQAAATASVAQAIGGGASVGADGGIVMPAIALTSLGSDKAQPTTLLGAVAALDGVVKDHAEALRDVGAVVDAADSKASQAARQLQGFAPDETVAARIDEVKKNSLAWDQGQGVYNAGNASAGQNRIANLAAGQAATDAVNKGQLDQAIAQVKDQGNGLVKEAGGQLQVGRDSAATAVDLAGSAPRRDANGNVLLGADGKPVMALLDRQVTGVAAGVNGNDAVNKAQLDGVAQTAVAAQAAAADAGKAAGTAQGAATAAQTTANAAQGAAAGARQAADAAQAAAVAAQQSAGAANAKLAGIGAGETVAGRIDQAAKAAADAAGQAAGQALADALGGGSTVGADGKATAPAYAVSQIGADGTVAAQPQTASNVGAALAAIDANVIKVNERVLAQDAKATQLTQDLRDLRDDSLLWDRDAGAFSASHGGESPNRIVNLADGQARTDAVNKGQLDTVAQAAGAAQSAADQARQLAGTAQETAAAALQTADAAQGTATAAQQAAVAAQGSAADAAKTADAAQGSATGAQQAAQAAQDTASGAQRTADSAQGLARTAQQTADAAQGAATAAQRTADAAQGTATQAKQTAEAAQGVAASARQSADVANAKLAGIGDGETVAGRIDQAAKAAVDTAGQAAGQALATALGGGSSVGADGKPTAPAYAISQIGADGTVAAQALAANNVGDALAAVDANVIQVNDRVLAQNATLTQLTQDMRDLRGDSLQWDAQADAFSAARGGQSPNRIINVAAGQSATDAVNKGQLDTVAQVASTAQSAADKAGQDAAVAQGTAVSARQTAESAQGAAANAQQSVDAANAKLAGIGANETVAGRIAQAGQAANQSLADALGGGATVRADGTLQGPAYAVTAIGPEGRAQPPSAPAANVADAIKTIDGSVVAINDNVNKIGAGVTSMRDQLNTGELGLVRQEAATRDITVAAQSDGTRVRVDGTAGVRTVAGVKAGEVSAASTEVVVGSQLFSVSQDLQRNSQAVGDLEALTGRQGVTLAALSDQVGSGDVGLTRHDPSSNTVSLAADRGGNTVDVSGKDGARQVTGLQDGRIQAGSTDAVTGGQLNTVAERVDRLNAQGAGVAVDSRGDGSDRAVVTPGSRGVAVGANAQATGKHSIATGAGASAQGAGATAVGAGSAALATGSTAVGANATAAAPGSVAIGEGAQATRANTVSVGSAGAERQIANVAPATHETDAVNLRQAVGISRQEAGRALEQANRYTDSRIGALRSEVNAGIASAMAMAALPATSTPGKSMFSMGTALYSGQSAVAMGVSGRSHNGAWMYRASSSSTPDGEIGAAVGVGYEW